MKKWLKSADSCPYCRDKLPATLKPLSRYSVPRLFDDTGLRRPSIQQTANGGSGSAEGIGSSGYGTSAAIGDFGQNQIRARAFARARLSAQASREDAARQTEPTDARQPETAGFNAWDTARGRLEHSEHGESFIDFINAHPSDFQPGPSTSTDHDSRSGAHTLPDPPLEYAPSYPRDMDFVTGYRNDTGILNRQQIAPSTSVPPTRRALPPSLSPRRPHLHPSVYQHHSYMMSSHSQPFGDASSPWASTQSASTQTGQASREVNDMSPEPGQYHSPTEREETHLPVLGSPTESNASTAAVYNHEASPTYLRGGFVRSPAHYTSHFRYPTASNSWEVAR